MPFYTFKCEACNVETEELVRMGTESTACKTCGKPTVKLPSFRSVAVGLPNGFHTIRTPQRKGNNG